MAVNDFTAMLWPLKLLIFAVGAGFAALGTIGLAAFLRRSVVFVRGAPLYMGCGECERESDEEDFEQQYLRRMEMTSSATAQRELALERLGRYEMKILPDHTMTFSESENGAWMRAPEVLPALVCMQTALERIKEAYDGCDGCIGGECSWCIANQALEELSRAMSGQELRRPGHAAACQAPSGPIGGCDCHCHQNHDSHD